MAKGIKHLFMSVLPRQTEELETDNMGIFETGPAGELRVKGVQSGNLASNLAIWRPI